MKPNSSRISVNHSGFTLVEIMVGLAIGLVLTLVIMQVSTVFEAQKRATTGTSDAQTNGGIALYSIGRELRLAGYPILPVTNSPLECTTLKVDGVADNPIPSLSPVTITEGVAGGGVSASDTITIRYGDSTMGGVPTQLTALPAASGATAAPAQDVAVTSNLGCKINDKILITNGSACAITTAKAIPGTTTITFGDADATKTAVTVTQAVVGANLACLGSWNTITYAVSNGNLQRNGTDSVPGIVNIQAQYGVSASGLSNTSPDFNKITSWVDASGGTWATPTVVDRNRIKAIRIAVVARNSKMEPGVVTTACSSTTAANPTGLCAWEGTGANPAPTIDLSQGDANWARYRYRVFETIIPLRNVIWSKDTL
ncbi:MAG TPA: PilW family protein [Burkholderiaceae bacterium]|jgi:type IV pilus assembly protein PilW